MYKIVQKTYLPYYDYDSNLCFKADEHIVRIRYTLLQALEEMEYINGINNKRVIINTKLYKETEYYVARETAIEIIEGDTGPAYSNSFKRTMVETGFLFSWEEYLEDYIDNRKLIYKDGV